MTHAGGQWPAALDETASQQQSWIGAAGSGALDPADPVGSSTTVGLALIDDVGFPGNWTLRALGGPAAQEDAIFHDRFQLSGPGDVFSDCTDCPTMVIIPAGSFTQGSPPDEPQSYSDERPQHTVNVPAFAMGQHEVTFDEWDACVADGGCTHTPDDQGWGRGDRPVIAVNWNDAQQYVTWLSNKTGHTYRLPSESEWEYATRAGTTGRFNTGDCITTDQANFYGPDPAQGCPSGEYRGQTLPVGSFAPNAFGLYDTHGNVWEWVQDCWNGSYEGAPTDGSAWMSGDCSRAVLRGGSWSYDGRDVRSANRHWSPRGFRYGSLGFRVARSVAL
ncbi:MAG: formylglycine-generating enzyme family protein [Pseudomonadota bacterium]|nr:MAG: formylglycine-generating enzyme family protein [Pseudomonadota bacterium]